MTRILITPRSMTRDRPPQLDRLTQAGFELVACSPGRQPTEQELCSLVPGCAGYLAGVERITARVLSCADALKVISRNGVGVDNIELEVAERLGIKVCTALGVNSRGVAELTVACMLALARSIPRVDAHLKTRTWQRLRGIELAGRTVGLVGLGAIGTTVAGLAWGLGMRVVAYDPFANRSFEPNGPFAFVELDELLAQSDVVSLHCPSARGEALIDRRAIGRMKDGAYLINTARADLVDGRALLESLDAGKLAGAAIDVFEAEPPDDWSLAEHPKVIATAHVGGYTDESVGRATQAAVENLLANLP